MSETMGNYDLDPSEGSEGSEQKEQITMEGVTLYDNGTFWSVLVGPKSFTLDKEGLDQLPPDQKNKLFTSLREAQKSSMDGRVSQDKLIPAIEVVNRFNL
ncbi:MAG: hypothetical protein GF353_07440 [Candidatus Lokiarchaeota archaeon]|nr:hypothetical protein [Candidatus Lokiarchaeota archaeon]